MKNVLKKAGAAVLALTLTAALAGCGSSASSAAASSDTAAASTADTADETELDKVKAAGKLVVGVEGTYPPFTYHDDNGELTGLDIELGKALADKLGVEVEFQEAAWDSLLIGIDTERFDTVINSVSITDERAEKYDFSDPYYYEARRVVVRADDDSIHGPEDLNGKKIATNTTNAFIPWYEEQGVEVVGIDTSGEAIDLVKKHMMHGHEFDREKFAGELGDIAWYLAEAAQAIGMPLEEVFRMNIDKLNARYPEGFSAERSRNRE